MFYNELISGPISRTRVSIIPLLKGFIRILAPRPPSGRKVGALVGTDQESYFGTSDTAQAGVLARLASKDSIEASVHDVIYRALLPLQHRAHRAAVLFIYRTCRTLAITRLFKKSRVRSSGCYR